MCPNLLGPFFLLLMILLLTDARQKVRQKAFSGLNVTVE
jgi:hypothetical protein